MSSYRFNVEFVYEDEEKINRIHQIKEERLDKVSRYIHIATDHDPIMKPDMKYSRDDISYSANTVEGWRKVVVEIIFADGQTDETFDPDKFKNDLVEKFGGHPNFKRVHYSRPPTL